MRLDGSAFFLTLSQPLWISPFLLLYTCHLTTSMFWARSDGSPPSMELNGMESRLAHACGGRWRSFSLGTGARGTLVAWLLPAWPATSSLGFLPMKETAAQQGVAGVLCGHRSGSQMRWWTRATEEETRNLCRSLIQKKRPEVLQAWGSPPLLPARPTPLGADRSEEHNTRTAFGATGLVLQRDQT